MAATENVSRAIVILNVLQQLLDDESEEDEEFNYITVVKRRQKRRVAKVLNFVTETVPKYTVVDFKEHFRINRVTFEALSLKLMPILIESQEIMIGIGRENVPVDHQILIALWLLANQESFRGVGDRFGVCRRTAWKCLMRIVKAINILNQQAHIIAWSSRDKAMNTATVFSRKHGVTGVIGCIDGKHISIIAPMDDAQSYINRKGFHSIILQGVCDEHLCFIHCYVGEVGSVHDSTVLKRSEVYERVCTGRGFPNNNFHIIGDGAYQLSKYVLVPYRDNGALSRTKLLFNRKFSSCRQYIERAFAHLVGRFRRLKYLDMSRMDLMVQLIAAACVMHNICIMQDDSFVWDLETEPSEQDQVPVCVEQINEDTDKQCGLVKRERMANMLYANRNTTNSC